MTNCTVPKLVMVMHMGNAPFSTDKTTAEKNGLKLAAVKYNPILITTVSDKKTILVIRDLLAANISASCLSPSSEWTTVSSLLVWIICCLEGHILDVDPLWID